MFRVDFFQHKVQGFAGLTFQVSEIGTHLLRFIKAWVLRCC